HSTVQICLSSENCSFLLCFFFFSFLTNFSSQSNELLFRKEEIVFFFFFFDLRQSKRSNPLNILVEFHTDSKRRSLIFTTPSFSKLMYRHRCKKNFGQANTTITSASCIKIKKKTLPISSMSHCLPL
ncbi:hypothetical protein SSS_06530, partial [Sarcoptes scabiei]